MKNVLKFVVALFLSNSMYAQISINSNDMPNVNDTFRVSLTANIQGNDPTLAGTNYTWNYASLIPVSQRIDTFYAVSSTPLAYQFYFNNIFLYPNYKASYALRGRVSISDELR